MRARFDADRHDQRLLTAHPGRTPAETLQRFGAVVTSTTAASGHTPAWLGEVVVHAQDIRRPLGLTRTPDTGALTQVADFFARRDVTVASRTLSRGLRLEATDGPSTAGQGPVVTGTTLALTMVMAGRAAYLEAVDGPGAAVLRQRVEQGGA